MALVVVACAVPLSAPADSTQHAIIAQPRFLKLLKASQGSRSEAPSQLELWHGEALCCTAVSRKPGESRCHRADERADWLVVNEGLSQDEAKLQVVREFPDVFAAPQPQNTTQTQARAVFWLHIPKCGSSFRSSVEMYPVDDAHSTACPEECGPHIDNHVYLPMDASDETIGNVAAIFREPKQRLASQHAHMVKANKPPSWCAKKGRDGGRWGWPSEADCQLVLEKLSLGVDHALGSYDGCQTNMILGKQCMSQSYVQHPAKQDVVAEAVTRMHQFRFVGIQSEWFLSMCLFTYLQTGLRQVAEVQLENNRPTDGSVSSTYDGAGIHDDPLDGPLYTEASRRFWHDVKRFNISTASCAAL